MFATQLCCFCYSTSYAYGSKLPECDILGPWNLREDVGLQDVKGFVRSFLFPHGLAA